MSVMAAGKTCRLWLREDISIVTASKTYQLWLQVRHINCGCR